MQCIINIHFEAETSTCRVIELDKIVSGDKRRVKERVGSTRRWDTCRFSFQAGKRRRSTVGERDRKNTSREYELAELHMKEVNVRALSRIRSHHTETVKIYGIKFMFYIEMHRHRGYCPHGMQNTHAFNLNVEVKFRSNGNFNHSSVFHSHTFIFGSRTMDFAGSNL